MRRRERARKFVSALGAALAAAMTWSVAAQAVDCPRKGTLGTSRVLPVDAARTPRVGLMSFPQTLPLEDHEVVLTFDDRPLPAPTPRVLAATDGRRVVTVAEPGAPGPGGSVRRHCVRFAAPRFYIWPISISGFGA